MTTVMVTTEHLRMARDQRLGGHIWCLPGARMWCERYGFEFRAFATDGLPADQLAATGDHYGVTLAALALATAEQQGEDNGRQ